MADNDVIEFSEPKDILKELEGGQGQESGEKSTRLVAKLASQLVKAVKAEMAADPQAPGVEDGKQHSYFTALINGPPKELTDLMERMAKAVGQKPPPIPTDAILVLGNYPLLMLHEISKRVAAMATDPVFAKSFGMELGGAAIRNLNDKAVSIPADKEEDDVPF